MPKNNETKKNNTQKSLWFITITMGIFILCLISINIYLFITVNSSKQTISKLNDRMLRLEMDNIKLMGLDSKLNNYINSNKKDIKRLNDLAEKSYFVDATKTMVTDEFYIEFCVFHEKFLIIDLAAQPQFNLKYEGRGRFSVSDRELKSAILDISKPLKDMYNSVCVSGYKWDDMDVEFGIRGYNIGTIKNGVLKLKGE